MSTDDKNKSLTPQQLSTYRNKIEKIIREKGHAVQGVMGSETTVAYAYTVGLSNTLKRELIVLGLPPQTAQGVLNLAAVELKKTPEQLPEVLDKIANFPIHLRVLPASVLLAVCAITKLVIPDLSGVELVQLVWPDVHGVYPDEDNCDKACVAQQDFSMVK